jgi:hypothetical protein
MLCEHDIRSASRFHVPNAVNKVCAAPGSDQREDFKMGSNATCLRLRLCEDVSHSQMTSISSRLDKYGQVSGLETVPAALGGNELLGRYSLIVDYKGVAGRQKSDSRD